MADASSHAGKRWKPNAFSKSPKYSPIWQPGAEGMGTFPFCLGACGSSEVLLGDFQCWGSCRARKVFCAPSSKSRHSINPSETIAGASCEELGMGIRRGIDSQLMLSETLQPPQTTSNPRQTFHKQTWRRIQGLLVPWPCHTLAVPLCASPSLGQNCSQSDKPGGKCFHLGK